MSPPQHGQTRRQKVRPDEAAQSRLGLCPGSQSWDALFRATWPSASSLTRASHRTRRHRLHATPKSQPNLPPGPIVPSPLKRCCFEFRRPLVRLFGRDHPPDRARQLDRLGGRFATVGSICPDEARGLALVRHNELVPRAACRHVEQRPRFREELGEVLGLGRVVPSVLQRAGCGR